MIFTDIYELLRDMYLCGEKSFLVADEPLRLMIGWMSERTGKTWNIRIPTLKRNLTKHFDSNTEERDMLVKFFSSMEKRVQMIQFLEEFKPYLINKFPEIPRYEKLKVFW